MKKIQITGATLGERVLHDGGCDAWYTCNKCGQELAFAEHKKTPQEAREVALTLFDYQCRNYCYTCGNKLTDKEVIIDHLSRSI